MKRVLSWIKPTGDGMHIWNYFWAFRPLVELSKWTESYLMLADIHSLTSIHTWDVLRKNKRRMIIEYLSLLPDDSNIIIFEQSKTVFHDKAAWCLLNVTPYSLMLRAHSFKDSQNKNSEINMWVFNYPILMASDILLYDIDMVTVWKDQKQHIEFTRDIAGNFNKTYGVDFFKLPEPHIDSDIMTIPWTDGRKMSKSYNNFIGIFDDEKTIKSRIMSITTDDTSLEEPKDPDNCNVFALIQLLASSEKQEEIRKKYLAWGYGYGHAKLELLDIFLDYFKDARYKYDLLQKDDAEVYKRIQNWNNIASEIAKNKYLEMEKIVWLI